MLCTTAINTFDTSRVCLSVRHTSVCVETTGLIEPVFVMEASFHLSHTVEMWVSPKITVRPCGTLSQTPDLENFATPSRSRCQQNLSSSSTVELVDDTYTTIDESWLFKPTASTIRYDTRCYFNVRSKANMSQLNLPHVTDN